MRLQMQLLSLMMCSLALVVGITNCSKSVSSREPELDTSVHEHLNMTWGDSPIEADFRWRFISHKTAGEEVEITGAWDVTFRNPSNDNYKVAVAKFSFVDSNDLQVAQYTTLLGILGYYTELIISAGQTYHSNGNFTITVASVTIGNSIVKMQVWSTVTKQ